jgi:hypothetical protein
LVAVLGDRGAGADVVEAAEAVLAVDAEAILMRVQRITAIT